MSSSPGKIIRDITVTMPRGRERSNPRFGELTEELLTLLEDA
jgi:ABC-type nitrate/sulfonate/bicarbonate transport system ATPase subunit